MSEETTREQLFFLKSTGKRNFGVRSIMPANQSPVAIVLIIPGMMEHAGRYLELGRFLASHGFGVFCLDHPGAGITAGDLKRLGQVPQTRGWEIMLGNIRTLYTFIRKEIPEVPLYVFGHSMGSVLARHFVAVYPVYIQGLILSGPFETSYSLLKISRIFTSLQILIFGAKTKSKWFNKFFTARFNHHFKDRPTRFEWISSVREEVDEYVNDPYCGYDCSWGFYKTLFKGIAAMKKAQHNLKYRKTLAFLLICGEDDPVGNFGKDALRIHRDFYRQKFQNIIVKIFKGRHELNHEGDKNKVYQYLLDWLNEYLKP